MTCRHGFIGACWTCDGSGQRPEQDRIEALAASELDDRFDEALVGRIMQAAVAAVFKGRRQAQIEAHLRREEVRAIAKAAAELAIREVRARGGAS